MVVGGGGVGALEAAFALRSLAGDQLELELIAPERWFRYRALAVGEPFGSAGGSRYDLREVARFAGFRLSVDVVERVDPGAQRVGTRGGSEVLYDTLLLALGARPASSVPGALTFGGHDDVGSLAAAIRAVAGRERAVVAFVGADTGGWTLPVYELALMTAHWASAHRAPLQVVVVTPEAQPLGAFGAQTSGQVAQVLERNGIALHVEATARQAKDGQLHLSSGAALAADLVVAMPTLMGPSLGGLPHDGRGFVPVDEFGRVRGVDDVYAVGDMTHRNIKQGGLTAQQADAAASHIAAHAGADVHPEPYRPVLRGLLLTGDDPIFLRAAPDATDRTESLWWPAHKVVGQHLAAFLNRHRHLAFHSGEGSGG